MTALGDVVLVPRFFMLLSSAGVAPRPRDPVRFPGGGGKSRGRIAELVIAQLYRDRSPFHGEGNAPRSVRFADAYLVDGNGRVWSYGDAAAAIARDLRKQPQGKGGRGFGRNEKGDVAVGASAPKQDLSFVPLDDGGGSTHFIDRHHRYPLSDPVRIIPLTGAPINATSAGAA